MSTQAAEQAISYSDLLAYSVGLSKDEIMWGSAYTSGTRVWLRGKGGRWKAFLITDASFNAPATAPLSHGHIPNALPGIVGGTWTDPFTTTSTTFVALTGLTETITARTGAQGM